MRESAGGSREMTATPVPPSPVTITMTEEDLTSLVKEGLESAEGDAGSATGGLTIFDPVVTITNKQIELHAVTTGLLGDMDLYLATVPVVENGELHFHVTAATVSGISLPQNVVSQIEGELGQMLSQWPSGGSKIQGVTSVNEYHRLKLRSPIRDWSVHRESVSVETASKGTASSAPTGKLGTSLSPRPGPRKRHGTPAVAGRPFDTSPRPPSAAAPGESP